jgi:hypothetical protein
MCYGPSRQSPGEATVHACASPIVASAGRAPVNPGRVPVYPGRAPAEPRTIHAESHRTPVDWKSAKMITLIHNFYLILYLLFQKSYSLWLSEKSLARLDKREMWRVLIQISEIIANCRNEPGFVGAQLGSTVAPSSSSGALPASSMALLAFTGALLAFTGALQHSPGLYCSSTSNIMPRTIPSLCQQSYGASPV